MRRWLLLLAFLFLPAIAGAQELSLNRALLVGCDQFVSQQDTAPSAENNVIRMAETLSGGAMNLESLVTRSQGVTSVRELEKLVHTAFADADDNDVSYFYISTHGLWESGQSAGDMSLLLSDGTRESAVTARKLREIFDRVPGVKVLIIDACHAGAMIGKGVPELLDNVFAGPDYKVICSSGGAEASWYWAGESPGRPVTGEGYFSSALVSGLSAKGGYGADDNRDGVVTLTELKRYLLGCHGASTVRTYPEEDDFPILVYDAESFTNRLRGAAISNVSFAGDVLTLRDPEILFTFNLVRPAQVAYQLIYYRDGRWDFNQGELVFDSQEPFGSLRGYLSPGMKERAITLNLTDAQSYGYVLLQILTLNNNVPALSASRVLCVPPESGNPQLSLLVPEAFCPDQGAELTFVVQHQLPCELTVSIEDPEGNLVRRLASREATRPEQLQPRGSTFCWNGRSSRGEAVAAGEYRIHVKAYVGSEVYEIYSDPFLLAENNG